MRIRTSAFIASIACVAGTGLNPERLAGLQGAAAPIVDSQAFLEKHLPSPSPPDPAMTARILDLIGGMTLKEKIGQMTQLEIGMVTDGKDADLQINPAKLRKAVNDYGVGSILNVKDLALSIDKWRALVQAIQSAAAGTRLAIPVIYGVDTIHGATT